MRLAALLLATTACSGLSSDPYQGDLVAYTDSPSWLTISGNELYFVNTPSSVGPSYVMRTPKLGGGSEELIGNGDAISAITGDEHGVYWLQSEGGTTRVMAWSQGDTAPRVLGTNPNFANGSSLRNMVSDGVSLFYADYTGTVWRVPVTGSGLVELGMTDTSAGAVALAPDGVWVSTLTGAKKLASDGSTLAEVSVGTELPSSIACDGELLFVALAGSGDDDGSVKSVVNGQVTTLATHLVLPNSLVAADGHVYFVTGNSDAAVRRTPYNGGRAEPIAAGNRPADVAVDDAFAYYTDPYPGEIRRVPR